MINSWQIVFAVFFLIVIAISICAIIAIWKSPYLRFKPLWTIGSLFGFVGLRIDWATANDLIIQFGISIPAVRIWWLVNGDQTFVQAMFPVIALAALVKVRAAEKDSLIAIFADAQDD